MKKRFFALLLLLALIPWLFACQKSQDCPSQSEGQTGKNAGGAQETPTDDPAQREEEILQEMSMLDKMESWRGQGTDGRVDLPGSCQYSLITSLEELAPYRGYFPTLTDEDAKRIVSDTKGIVAVLEIASADTTLIYGVDEVTREDNNIFFFVSAAEEILDETQTEEGEEAGRPDPGSPFEYFLFYIPGEYYNNETLYFPFIG